MDGYHFRNAGNSRLIDMIAEEICNLAADELLSTVEGIDPAQAELVDGDFLCVGSLCVLPIFRTSQTLSRKQDLELEDENGLTFATICLTAGMQVDDPDALTAWQYVAFLADCLVDDLEIDGNYTFKSDYVVVDRNRLNEYVSDYRDGAPIWGGFSHEPFEFSSWVRPDSPIRAYSGLAAPTNHHVEAFHRYLSANNSFDRFLRLYHSIELLFDYVIFKKVQALGDNLVGYGDLMKETGRSELERLTTIAGEYCQNPNEIAHALNGASLHEATCRAIFQGYSKGGDPLKEDNFDKFWLLVAGNSVSIINLTNSKLPTNQGAEKLLIKVASYWVYRIRCSIAHNRVGEFMLADEHDEFVGEFGVSLLQSIVRQILSNPNFKGLSGP